LLKKGRGGARKPLAKSGGPREGKPGKGFRGR